MITIIHTKPECLKSTASNAIPSSKDLTGSIIAMYLPFSLFEQFNGL